MIIFNVWPLYINIIRIRTPITLLPIILRCFTFSTKLIWRAKRAHLVVQLARFYICVIAPAVLLDTVLLQNVSTRFYLGIYAVRNIAILCYTLGCSCSPTMLKHSSSIIFMNCHSAREYSACVTVLGNTPVNQTHLCDLVAIALHHSYCAPPTTCLTLVIKALCVSMEKKTMHHPCACMWCALLIVI